MNEERLYRVPKTSMIVGLIQYSYLIFFFGFILAIVLFESVSNLLILFIPTCGLIISVFYILLIPYKIQINDKTITFKSALKPKTYLIDDIIKIRSSFLYAGSIQFKFSTKNSIFIPSQFTDFYLLMYYLKKINPEINNYGC
jgi:hypothetical protein